jgi:hypothetical protein
MPMQLPEQHIRVAVLPMQVRIPLFINEQILPADIIVLIYLSMTTLLR